MGIARRRFAVLVAVVLGTWALGACATVPREALRAPGPVCDFGDLRLDGAIPQGRLSGCERTGPAAVTVRIAPETQPINPSPWYAFALECAACPSVRVTLAYTASRHRYQPLVSADAGATWAPLGPPALRQGGAQAVFDAPLQEGGVWIAAQPLYPVERHEAWLAGLAQREDVRLETFGVSLQGRPLRAVRIGAAAAPTVLLLGGQHPPETRGAIAFAAFAERLLAEDPLAERFRAAHHIVMAPLLNPDGVAAGAWRHSAGGVDLNRDWGGFSQPETRAVRDALARWGSPVLMIDFHGTRRDVIYSLPDGPPGGPPGFAADFDAALQARLGALAPPRSASHTVGGVTAKAWFHDVFGSPTMTYEVGDATPEPDIRRIAQTAAEELMGLMTSAR